MTIKFVGSNENHRWYKIGRFVWLAGIRGIFGMNELSLFRDGVTFEFQLDQETNPEDVWNILNNFAEYSSALAGKYYENPADIRKVIFSILRSYQPSMSIDAIIQSFEIKFGLLGDRGVLQDDWFVNILAKCIETNSDMVLRIALVGLKDWNASSDSSDLLKKLIEKEYGIDQIFQVSKEILFKVYEYEDEGKRYINYAFSLFEKLVNHSFKLEEVASSLSEKIKICGVLPKMKGFLVTDPSEESIKIIDLISKKSPDVAKNTINNILLQQNLRQDIKTSLEGLQKDLSK